MTHAFVCGCAGLALTPAERTFMTEAAPWGLILFKRNVASAAQLKSLVEDFRAAVGRPDAPVLIDQEGGRVQRLGPPMWPVYPAASAFGRLAAADRAAGRAAAKLGGRLIAVDLRAAGITIDCAPVLDLPAPGSSAVVGDRAFGTDPAIIAELARAFAEGLLAGGVLPVMKHMPGHGRAQVDSHFELPVVTADEATLAASDFRPFRALADLPLGMTAHVTFTAIDPDHPATTSRRVIAEIVRGASGSRACCSATICRCRRCTARWASAPKWPARPAATFCCTVTASSMRRPQWRRRQRRCAERRKPGLVRPWRALPNRNLLTPPRAGAELDAMLARLAAAA